MTIGSYSFRENTCVVCSELNVKLLILKGEDRFVPALPLLKLAVLIAVVQADFTSRTFGLDPQAFLILLNEKSVTGCPA